MSKKSEWIASQMPIDTDPWDVEDVLLGNITEPSSFVALVQSYEQEYDEEFDKWSRKVSSSLGD